MSKSFEKGRQSVLDELEAELPERDISNDGAGMGGEPYVDGYNDYCEKVLEIIKTK
jgi:hypothetical protein